MSITTISAALFLNISCACNGNDRRASEFLSHAKSIGETLDLFGPASETVSNILDDAEVAWLRVQSSTAWGLFNFVTWVFLPSFEAYFASDHLSLRAFAYQDYIMSSPPKFVIPYVVIESVQVDC